MKKLLFSLVVAFCINSTYAQTPKEQVAQGMAIPSADYLITNNSVGYFKLGGFWQKFAKINYGYKFIQGYGSCMDACCDGGFSLGKVIKNSEYGKIIENPEITIGASSFSKSASKTQHKANPKVFYITSDNCSGWYWKDKINYVIVYSEAFKTKEGIGVGTTLERIKELQGNVVIKIGWIEEDGNAIHVKVNSYPDIEFILDADDAIGGYEKLSTFGEKPASITDFKANTKIKRLIIQSTAK